MKTGGDACCTEEKDGQGRPSSCNGPYPGPGRCELAIAIATEYMPGFGAVMVNISPAAYRAALEMPALEAAGLISSRMKLQKDLQGETGGLQSAPLHGGSAPRDFETRLPGGGRRVVRRMGWDDLFKG